MPHPFAPSTHQQAYFSWVQNGKGSAILNAVAGAGKTTSCCEALQYIPSWSSVQMLAFNAIAAQQLRDKIAEIAERENRNFNNFRADTFHSKGLYAIHKKLDGRATVLVDDKKLNKICKLWLGEDDMYLSYIIKLVSFAKGQGFRCLVPDTDDNWYRLISHHDLYLDDEDATVERAVELAKELLIQSNKAAIQGHIDFNDQIYLPILWKLRLWQNDWVFVDEAQDTSPVRRALVKLMLKPGGRLVAVGDPKQGINGFAGASADAMDLIKREFNCTELGLPVSYRCSLAAIARAKTIVPWIEAWDGASAGEDTTATFDEVCARLLPTDAILCRNTAPLVDYAFRLIGKGIGCTVLGRSIGDDLIGLIKQQKARGIAVLQDRLDAYRSREEANYLAKGEEQKAEAVNDRCACINHVINHLSERTVPGLITKIEDLFSDKTGGTVTLSTGHKAKGREWSNVFVLCPELMPSKYARQEHQQKQERHLQYVIWTRTKGDIIDIVE